jgi:phosphoglycolate phosphatase
VKLRYRLAVFDSDGTLVDSLPWFAKAFNEVCSRHGLKPVSDAEHAELRGLTGMEMLRRLKIPLWRLPKLVAEMRRLMAEHIKEFSLYDGIEESLVKLDDAGVVLGIVSSNSAENVRHILGPKIVARIRYFNCGASMFGKPSKIRALLKAAGVPAREAIYVGDEVRDAEAATKVGMAYGAVAWGYHPIETLRSHAAEVFHGPCEIGERLTIR